MDVQLARRGRAMLDFEVTARQTADRLHREVEQVLAQKGLDADDMDGRHEVIEEASARSKVHGARALFGGWCASQHGLACDEAFYQARFTPSAAFEAAVAARRQNLVGVIEAALSK